MHGAQEMSVWNGHHACTCYHLPFVFNQFGDLERSALRSGNVHSADGWDGVLKPDGQGHIPRQTFQEILRLIAELRPSCEEQGIHQRNGMWAAKGRS